MKKDNRMVHLVMAVVVAPSLVGGPTRAEESMLRRPTALALADEGRWLYAANRRSGSISVIDATASRLVGEVAVGCGLSDLVLTPDGSHLLCTDGPGGELVILHRSGPSLDRIARLKVGPAPVSVRVGADGSRGFVASLWSRQITVVDLSQISGQGEDEARIRIISTIALPFAPREQIWIPPARKLVVAEAFGGRLGVIDVDRGVLECVRSLPAHNIRGMALSPDGERLILTHQLLASRATTSSDDIHWGNLITNNLRSLSLDALLDPGADPLRDGRLDQLGDIGHGTGDPAGLAVNPDGMALVALSGVGEVALGRDQGVEWQYLEVGRRPTAVVISPDGLRAYVADTFEDAIAVVDLRAKRVMARLALGPCPELSPADRGEVLFYDARLAREGWMSCHSCHSDGHTNGLLADTLGDGSFGTPKRILSLLGVGDTGPWAWNGSVPDLETQVRKSIQLTMQGNPPSDETVSDLAAFLRTLPAPPPAGTPRNPAEEEAVARGREVFRRFACGRCHTPPAYTSSRAYQVGLADELGNSEFNPPSLRGIGQADSFFHDNRATTLDEVFTRHRHQLGSELTEHEREDLVRFLRTR
jgi:DNA-binding beta-propeller fold protein YncE